MKKLISLFLSLTLLTALTLPVTAVQPDHPQLISSQTETDDLDALIAQWQQSTIDAEIQAAGGVPGQLNVMMNGVCIPFTDAAPEMVNSRTMVPLRASMEALGAKVDYDAASRSALVVLDDLSFTHIIGTDTLTLADGSSVKMDVASYTKNNRTMVPLRFFSQALSYEVYWDQTYQTAVIVDKDAFVQSIDSRFSILNDVMKQQNAALDYTKNLQADAKLSGALTLMDTISGNTDYKFSADMSALIGKEAADISMSMDLSFVSQILSAMEEDAPQWLDALLKNLSLRMICSGNTAWVNSPALVQAMKEEGAQLPDGDLWFQADGLDEVTEMPYLDYIAKVAGGTLGEQFYLVASSMSELSPFTAYSQVRSIADVAALAIGDDTWTKSGSTYQWHMDMDTLGGLVEALTGEDDFFTAGSGITFSMDMTVQANGNCTFKMDGSVRDETTGKEAAKLTASGSSSAVESQMDLRLQIINLCDLTLTSSSTVKTTSKAPATQPPAGAVILDEDYQLPA